MSTRIGHGYVARFETMSELDAFIRRFRSEARAWCVDALAKRFASECAEVFDRWSLGLSEIPEKESAASKVWNDALDRYRETRGDFGKRCPKWDFECSLTLLPDPCDPASVHVLLGAEQEGYHDILLGFPGLTWCPWWDNTDPPDDVSREEWDRRETAWKRALGDRGVPGGLRMEVLGPVLPLPGPDELAEHLPDVASRAERIGKRLAVERHTASTLGREQGFGLGEFTRVTMDYVGTAKHAAETACAIGEMRRRLKPNLSVDDLMARGPKAVENRFQADSAWA